MDVFTHGSADISGDHQEKGSRINSWAETHFLLKLIQFFRFHCKDTKLLCIEKIKTKIILHKYRCYPIWRQL